MVSCFHQQKGPGGGLIARQHRLLLAEVTAGVIGQKNGVAIGSQQFSPTLKRFRVVPQTMGNHRQSTEVVASGSQHKQS
jgi:hypothetical protein